MGPQCAAEAGRAPLLRFACRAVVLAALGTGLWLAGLTTATAEELTPPSTAAGTASSAVDAVATPRVGLLGPASSASTPARSKTGSNVVSAVAPGPAAVAPVVPVPVVPVVSAAAPAVHSAVVSVADLAVPMVQAAEPVLEPAATLRDVAAPVLATLGQSLPPVADAAVTLAGALDPLLAPVAGALDPLLKTDLIGTQERPDTDLHGPNEVVQGSAAGPSCSGHVMAPAGDDVIIVAGMGGAGGGPAPVRPPSPGTGGPVRAACTGAHSFDQSPADLPAAVLATITAALAATADARHAAGNIASDPSFSPD